MNMQNLMPLALMSIALLLMWRAYVLRGSIIEKQRLMLDIYDKVIKEGAKTTSNHAKEILSSQGVKSEADMPTKNNHHNCK